MRSLKKFIVFLMGAALVTAGCAKAPTQNGGNQAKSSGGKVRIGFSMDTLKEERWQRDRELVEAHAREVGADIITQVANGSDSLQLAQAENMLTQGVNVLIVAPHDGQAAKAIVESAHRQNVPVISYDRLILGTDVDLYLSHQVIKIGEMQAQYALDHLNQLPNAPKPANFVLVQGSPTDNNAKLLHDGQMNILNPAVQRGDIRIVVDQPAREWKAEEALNITENALTQTNNNIQAVVASNDGTAGGAIRAIEEQNLTGKVIVTGQDAELAACQRIAEGKQTMTVYKPIKPLAYAAVDAAMKLAHGERVETHDTVDNGKPIPAILIPPVSVDRSNMADTVIRDGYHKLEEVYANVPREQWPKPQAQSNTNANARNRREEEDTELFALICNMTPTV